MLVHELISVVERVYPLTYLIYVQILQRKNWFSKYSTWHQVIIWEYHVYRYFRWHNGKMHAWADEQWQRQRHEYGVVVFVLPVVHQIIKKTAVCLMAPFLLCKDTWINKVASICHYEWKAKIVSFLCLLIWQERERKHIGNPLRKCKSKTIRH